MWCEEMTLGVFQLTGASMQPSKVEPAAQDLLLDSTLTLCEFVHFLFCRTEGEILPVLSVCWNRNEDSQHVCMKLLSDGRTEALMAGSWNCAAEIQKASSLNRRIVSDVKLVWRCSAATAAQRAKHHVLFIWNQLMFEREHVSRLGFVSPCCRSGGFVSLSQRSNAS